jgi:hypothetical protein
LLKLYRQGRLKLSGPAKDLDLPALVQQMEAKKWEVFIRPAFDDPQRVYDYLAKYIYRIAISNHRIVAISAQGVRFTYHDNKDGAKEKTMTLPGVEFMRRFLLHVLPARFVRVRHYGLHHTACRQALQRCRALLGLTPELPQPRKLVLREWLEQVTGEQPASCPFCGVGHMQRIRDFAPVSPLKGFILTILGVSQRGQVVG